MLSIFLTFSVWLNYQVFYSSIIFFFIFFFVSIFFEFRSVVFLIRFLHMMVIFFLFNFIFSLYEHIPLLEGVGDFIKNYNVGIQLTIDFFTKFAYLFFSFFFIFFLVACFDYFFLQENARIEFIILTFFIYLAGIFLVSSKELIEIFILLECITFCAYVLVSFERKNKSSSISGIRYLIIGSIPSSFLILAFCFLYYDLGSLIRENIELNLNSFFFTENLSNFFIENLLYEDWKNQLPVISLDEISIENCWEKFNWISSKEIKNIIFNKDLNTLESYNAVDKNFNFFNIFNDSFVLKISEKPLFFDSEFTDKQASLKILNNFRQNVTSSHVPLHEILGEVTEEQSTLFNKDNFQNIEIKAFINIIPANSLTFSENVGESVEFITIPIPVEIEEDSNIFQKYVSLISSLYQHENMQEYQIDSNLKIRKPSRFELNNFITETLSISKSEKSQNDFINNEEIIYNEILIFLENENNDISEESLKDDKIEDISSYIEEHDKMMVYLEYVENEKQREDVSSNMFEVGEYFLFNGVEEDLNEKVNNGFNNFVNSSFNFYFFYDNINLLIQLSIILILINFLFKVTGAPFHVWAPTIYHGTSNSIVFFLTSFIKIIMFVFFILIFSSTFYTMKYIWGLVILISSILSFISGMLGAFSEKYLKKFIIYSSIGHVGFLLMGLPFFILEGSSVTINYLIVYTLSSIILWYSILLIKERLRFLTDLRYLIWGDFFLRLIISLNIFSLSGIPPLAGFFVKFDIFYHIISSSNFIFVAFVFFMTVINFFYYLRLVKIIHFENYSYEKKYLKYDSVKLFFISFFIHILLLLPFMFDATIFNLIFQNLNSIF